MKRTLASLLVAGALLLAPTATSANTQVYSDVTNATQNEILKKISAAKIMGPAFEGSSYFNPSDAITRGEVATVIQRAYKLYNVRPAKEFNDVLATDEHADAIQALYRAGIIDGTASGDFNPNDALKRTHLAKILTNLLKLSPQSTTKFKDVPQTDANNGYIGALVQKGIIAGHPDGTFKPNQAVTRMNMATFMYRALYGKEPQIENKKITSNSPYSATKLKAANYQLGGTTAYLTYDKYGNSTRKAGAIFQETTKDYLIVAADSTDFFLSVMDLRGLVEFKPQLRSDYVPYDEFFNYYIEYYDLYNEEAPVIPYTLIPYFNQTERINGTTYTNVLKVTQEFEEKGFSDYEYYFKEGFGLIKMTQDGETIWSIRSYTLR